MKAPIIALIFGGVLLSAVAASAQSAIDDAKAKYEAAEYEEALATLTRAAEDTTAKGAEFEQYRVLCLLALGDTAKAERAVRALVDADPTYVVPTSIASPKVLSTIADMRKKYLPAVARQLLNSGRQAFEAKDFARARSQFDLLLKVLADPAVNQTPELDDLRSLAQGFATLVTAQAATPPPTPERSEPAATPPEQIAMTKPAGELRYTDVYEAAVAIDQQLPPWEPPSVVAAKMQFSGSLRLRIGVDGKVKDASMEKSVHPAYDPRLMRAALSWNFKPATRNGIAIESEKTIAVVLRPTQ
jgi:tetratricopeptide (TPR) repeat protein